MNNKRSNFRFAYVVSEIAKKFCYEKSFLSNKTVCRISNGNKVKGFFWLSGQMESHKNAYTELITI